MKQLTNLLSLNKQTNIIATILLLMSLCFVSCGGDDDGSNSKVVDGVNVNTGRKLVRLDIHEPINNSYYGLDEVVYKLRIDYDSKGRLSKVILTNDYKYENGKYVEIDATKELLNIDYDLKIVNIFKEWSYYKNDYMFSLNDKGYISQIANCGCTYDSYGYLTGVDSNSYIWTLAYSENELIKSMVNNLVKGKLDIYYMFYGEDRDKGELVFYMNAPTKGYNSKIAYQGVLCFIAYQAGLFGKMTNHCTYLSKSSETSAFFQKKNEQNNNTVDIHCTFKYE